MYSNSAVGHISAATKSWSEALYGNRTRQPQMRLPDSTGRPMYSKPAVAMFFNMPNEDSPRVAFLLQPSASAARLTVDWPLRLRETPAPFTSRSPGIATLGPSCTPSRQLRCLFRPSNEGMVRTSFSRCSLNRQLDGQKRRRESNPLGAALAATRAVWLQRREKVSSPGIEPGLRASRARERIRHTPRTCCL